MDKYEITYLVANEEIAAKTIAAKAVEKAGGTVAQVRDMGQRNLAYKIKGLNSAYYGNIVVDLEPAMIAVIDRALRLDNNILRHIIVKGVYEQKPVQTEDDDKRAEARKADAIKSDKVQVSAPEVASEVTPEPVVEEAKTPVVETPVVETPAVEAPKVKKAKVADEVVAKPVKEKTAKPEETVPEAVEAKPKTAKKTPKDAISEDDRLAQLENKLEKLLNE